MSGRRKRITQPFYSHSELVLPEGTFEIHWCAHPGIPPSGDYDGELGWNEIGAIFDERGRSLTLEDQEKLVEKHKETIDELILDYLSEFFD